MCERCAIDVASNRLPASPSRRTALGMLGAMSLLGIPAAVRATQSQSPPKPDNALSPDEAIERLIAGNKRYITGETNDRIFASTRAALVRGQNPYACILSCADSRVSPELCFDEERGDLFVTRVAGNYVTNRAAPMPRQRVRAPARWDALRGSLKQPAAPAPAPGRPHATHCPAPRRYCATTVRG